MFLFKVTNRLCSLQASATPSARIPNDEIWVLDLERGAWWEYAICLSQTFTSLLCFVIIGTGSKMLSVYVLLQAFSLVVSLVITKLVKPLFCFFTQRRMFNMTGQVPPTMSGACGCSLKGDMYIFGGYDFSGQTNEVRVITEGIDEHSDAVDTYIHFRGLINPCWHMARNLINVSFCF